MPYIKEERREEVEVSLKPEDAGELNYLLTTIIYDYMVRKGKRYQVMNDIVGAIENSKLELYRRVIAPYEDKKLKENGDVY